MYSNQKIDLRPPGWKEVLKSKKLPWARVWAAALPPPPKIVVVAEGPGVAGIVPS